MPLTTRQATRKAWLIKALEQIEQAQLSGIKSGLTMTYNGRSLQRNTLTELSSIQKKFESELNTLEKIEAGTHTRTIRVIG